MNTVTNPPSKAAAVVALSEFYIVAVGFRGNSSGEVYALAMGSGVTLETHEAILRGLTGAGVIEQTGHRLTLTPLGADLCSVIMARVRNAIPA